MRGFGRAAASRWRDGHKLTLPIRSEGEAGANVFTSEIRKVAEDVVLAHAGRHVFENLGHGDPQATDAWLASALPGSIVIRDRQSTRSRYGRPEAYVNDTLYQLGRPFHPNHLSRLARDYVVAAGIAKRTEGFRFFFFSNEGREPPQVRGAAAGPGADARARVYFCGAVA